MASEILSQIIVLISLSIVVIYVGLKLKIPAIVGFLVTGVMVGPSGFGLVTEVSQINFLAELGVVLLLFTIGLEFSVSTLNKIKKIVLLGGGLQVACCIVVVYLVATTLGYEWNTALLFGFLFSLSSTAIVLKLLQESDEIAAPHGRCCLAVLIFQDLAVVPMVLLLPILAGHDSGGPVYMVLLKAAAVILVIWLMANTIVPAVLRRVAATRNRELFMFTVVLICLGTAYLTYKAGLSLALGAFAAGLVISSSPYAYQAMSSVLPMRDIFTSLFFVSIGMMMNINFLLEHPILTIFTALGVMCLNVIGSTLGLRLAEQNWRISFMVGLALCQVGEFSFVLAKDAFKLGLLSPDDMNLFLNASVLTMSMTPVALAVSRRVPALWSKKPNGQINEDQPEDSSLPPQSGEGHIIIVGFGVVGQAVARASEFVHFPYKVLELNPHTVKKYRETGMSIFYGDAVNSTILEHVDVRQAKILVSTIPDPVATRRIVALAKRMNPSIYVIARTRFLSEHEVLSKIGADDVVPEEYETAIAIFSQIMTRFMVPVDEIQKQVMKARAAGYHLLHHSVDKIELLSTKNYHDVFEKLHFLTISVQAGSYADGKNLKELNLRADYGLSVIMIKNIKNIIIAAPEGITRLHSGDVLMCIVSNALDAAEALNMFNEPKASSA